MSNSVPKQRSIVVWPDDIKGYIMVSAEANKILELKNNQKVTADVHTRILMANLIESRKKI